MCLGFRASVVSILQAETRIQVGCYVSQSQMGHLHSQLQSYNLCLLSALMLAVATRVKVGSPKRRMHNRVCKGIRLSNV